MKNIQEICFEKENKILIIQKLDNDLMKCRPPPMICHAV